MNSLYASYVPAINAYLNPLADPSCKSWGNVVNVFFKLNKDTKIASKTDLAEAFANAGHPNYFRIDSKAIDKYFDTFKISSAALINEGFQRNECFFEDEEGLRLSFSTTRRLVFSKGDVGLIEVFDFIDKIYQTFVRYELAMMNRMRRPTHWTIFKQVSKFSKAMQPHIDFKAKDGQEPAFRVMDTQPDIYCIVKGTLKTINARIVKYRKETNLYDEDDEDSRPSKFDPTPIVPIYESVLSNIDEEINSFVCHLDESYIQPYRHNQIGKIGRNKVLVEKLSQTKYHLKVSKTCMFIDPNQVEYTCDMLVDDIELIRSKLKYGKTTHRKKTSERKYANESVKVSKSKKNENANAHVNVVDIDIFTETEGKYIDEFKVIKLTCRDDLNVSLVEDISPSVRSSTTGSVDSEDFNDDEEIEEEYDEEEEEEEQEEEMDVEEEPVKPSRKKASTREQSVKKELKVKNESKVPKTTSKGSSKKTTKSVKVEEYDESDEA